MQAQAAASAHPTVTGAIRQAARITGTSFQYLLATAQVESNFNPNATGRTSSAQGLYQFIDQTWLATMKEEGPALGFGRFSNAIERAPNGQYAVSDPRMANTILNLRTNPTANAVMAGAFTKANAGKLAGALGRKPSDGELYVAHFLGPNGAARLIELAQASPRTRAAEAFPSAARANPSIFFNGKGQMRSAVDVYKTLVGRYDTARGPAVPAQAAPQLAAARPMQPVTPAMPVQQVQQPRRAAFAPDTATLTNAYATAAKLSEPPVWLGDNGPAFHGLFRSGQRPQAVAPVVSALWTAPKPVPLPEGDAAAAPTPAAEPATLAVATPVERGGALDLFQDRAPDARALFRGRV